MVVYEDFPISEILWYQIGGTVKHLFDISSIEDVKDALQYISEQKLKNVVVVGTGANILFTDKYFDGAVLRFNESKEPLKFTKDGKVTVFAGELLDTLIQEGFAAGFIGLEWAGGLPGTIGAAVRGNVGAFGGELKNNFESCEVFSLSDPTKTKTLQKHEMEFEYRGSIVKHNKELILIAATFHLSPATKEEVETAKEVYKKHIEYRKANHPHEYPNTGSVFKNIESPEEIKKVIKVLPDLEETVKTKWHGKVSAGYLITHMGFRGYKVGRAQVSERHGNFINNLGGARSQDVLAVIKAIQDKCQQTFGFTLDPEVEVIK